MRVPHADVVYQGPRAIQAFFRTRIERKEWEGTRGVVEARGCGAPAMLRACVQGSLPCPLSGQAAPVCLATLSPCAHCLGRDD